MSHGVEGSIFDVIVAAVKAEYDADDGAPAIDGERWKVGKLQGMGQFQANGVSWRRPSGTIEPTEHPGPHPWTDTSGGEQYFSSVYQQRATVTATIKAANWIQLGCIQTAVLTAVNKVMGIKGTPGSFEHITEGEDDPAPDAQKGVQELVQAWEWKIIIPHTTGTLTEIASIVGATHLINVNVDPGTSGPTITQPLP